MMLDSQQKTLNVVFLGLNFKSVNADISCFPAIKCTCVCRETTVENNQFFRLSLVFLSVISCTVHVFKILWYNGACCTLL